MKPASSTEPSPLRDAPPDARAHAVEAQLRHRAGEEAAALASDAAFHAALMARVARVDRGAGSLVRAEPASAAGWATPQAWLAMPVGLLLALGLWLSAGLMGHLEWIAGWAMVWSAPADAGPAVSAHLVAPVLEGLAGAVVAAWTAWVAWQASQWLLEDPPGVD